MTPAITPGSILSLSAQAADRLLGADCGDAALVYLHLLRHGGLGGLNWPPQRRDAALERLRRLGMAPDPEPAPEAAAPLPPAEDTAPDYSIQEISTALEDTAAPFSQLCDAVEGMLGKKLNANDLKTLYTLYDHLALPPEVLLLAVGWCVEECRRKYGPGRRPYLSQIRREGFAWARQGIDTADRAEEHLRRLGLLRSREGTLLRLLDLPARPLVERERSYLTAWQDMGFGDDALRLAYEKTVMKKGAMDWGYMNGILRRWHEKGLHTPEAVRAGDREGSFRPAAGTAAATPREQERAREDMARTRRLLEQMKREE